MAVQVDTRERKWAHIQAYFDKYGIEWRLEKCDVGDYMRIGYPNLTIDRKQHLPELCGNLCQFHERFKREIERAIESQTELIVLIEHGTKIKSLDDVRSWVNPRLKTSPKAITGARMAAIMETMAQKYGVEWRFCRKADTGRIICEILGEPVVD